MLVKNNKLFFKILKGVLGITMAATLFLTGFGTNTKAYAGTIDFKSELDKSFRGGTFRHEPGDSVTIRSLIDLVNTNMSNAFDVQGCFTVASISADSEYVSIEGTGADAYLTMLKKGTVTIYFTGTANCEHYESMGNKGLYGTVTNYPIIIEIYGDTEGEEEEEDVKESGKKGSAPCNHAFEWEVVREATAAQDGEEVYKCKLCGEVQSNSLKKVTGYSIFSSDTIKAIKNASGKEVIVETTIWESFPVKVLEELSNKKDVSLTIRYKHQGNFYTLTIPAGADLTAIIKENLFIGFRYLDSVFGGSQIIK